MSKIIFYSFVCSAIFCFGCQKNNSVTHEKNNSPAETMRSYLEKRNLPALESAGIWENDFGPGLIITTKHYEIYTTLLEPLMVSEIPGFVESAYRAYQNQFPSQINAQARSTIYLFKDRQQWEAFTKSFVKEQARLYLKIKAGAYYHNGSCIAYNIGREKTFSVIAHEGWHQFNNRHFKYRLPSWLDEGIAMQFEAFREHKGIFYFEPSQNLYRLGSLKKTFARGDIIPLKDIITVNPGQVIVIDEQAVAAFYSQAYALIRFLKEDDYSRLLPNYYTLLMAGLDGDWPLSDEQKLVAVNRNIPMTIGWNQQVGKMLFEEYIGEDFQKLEKQYLQFCRKIVYHVRLK